MSFVPSGAENGLNPLKETDKKCMGTRNPGDRPVQIGPRFSNFCWPWSSPRFGNFSRSWTSPVPDFENFLGPGPVRSQVLKFSRSWSGPSEFCWSWSSSFLGLGPNRSVRDQPFLLSGPINKNTILN